MTEVRIAGIGTTRPALEIETPLLVLGLFEGTTELFSSVKFVDEALGGTIKRLLESGEVSGELGSFHVIHNFAGRTPAQRYGIVGLGKEAEFGREAIRVAAATAARKARELKVKSYTTVCHGAGRGGLDPAEAARLVTEASLLALYRYEEFKPDRQHQVEVIQLIERDAEKAERMQPGIELGVKSAEATILARTLSDGPSNVVTPQALGEKAQELARKYGLECQVFGKAELERMGMNAILAVNAGSAKPPVLAVLRYRAPQAGAKTLAVVGKGITFDSGGISIKPAEGMEKMKHDMSGAAAVLGFLQLAAETQLPVHVLGVFAATENLPGGSAYKPGDVIRTYSGKTIEINNTDAEGRVILADAVAYAAEQKPDAIIDLATLTGACVVALGNQATGAMGTDDRLVELLKEAGELSGERVWQLPLWPVYLKQVQSEVAEIKNSAGRRAGAITGAAFIQHFTAGIPWVHLDIAGTAYIDDETKYVAPYNPKVGATGVGVRLLYHFARLWADAQR